MKYGIYGDHQLTWMHGDPARGGTLIREARQNGVGRGGKWWDGKLHISLTIDQAIQALAVGEPLRLELLIIVDSGTKTTILPQPPARTAHTNGAKHNAMSTFVAATKDACENIRQVNYTIIQSIDLIDSPASHRFPPNDQGQSQW